jgi:hypothetical protein
VVDRAESISGSWHKTGAELAAVFMVFLAFVTRGESWQ